MEKKIMLEKIQQGFQGYSQLVNKEIRYVYKSNGEYEEVVLKAKKDDFMHLCGVQYLDPQDKRKVSAKHFYSLVESNKISSSFLIEKEDGTTELKLNVIVNLKELLTPNIRIVDRQVTFSNNFTADKTLRSRREIFALALKSEGQDTNKYGPLSLLNLQTINKALLKDSQMIECIYVKDRTREIHIYHETPSYQEFRLHKEYTELEKAYKEKEKTDAM